MDKTQANEYVSRVNAVDNYIGEHIDQEMTLKELARVAGFSEYHFHRIFAAMMGETLFSYIQRLRLERAATRLCTDREQSITQIAMGCGFSSSAVFSRTFKKRFGLSPSVFRNRNQDQTDSSLGQLLRNRGKAFADNLGYSESALMENRDGRKMKWRFSMKPEVKIEKMQETRVAYIRYVGPYAGDGKLFENLYGRLGAFAQPRGIDLSTSYIVYHDDPGITDENKLRVSVCVPVGEEVEAAGEVCVMAIAGGDYAVGQFVLGVDEYTQAWDYMFAQWMPTSGYKPAAAPAFERYGDGGCDENGKMKVEICVPVEVMK